jgi:hypothetical protein
MAKFCTLAVGLVGFGLLAPAVRGEEAADSLIAEPVAVSTPAAAPAYVFKGDRFRDPFIPLVGASLGYEGPRASAEPISPFNPSNVELKGIIKTTSGRWAVLRTSEGVTYLIQNGKIYDPKRKPVEGFQCLVKEKSVVVMGPGKQESELLLKKESGTAP